jgi:hypothetical protein
MKVFTVLAVAILMSTSAFAGNEPELTKKIRSKVCVSLKGVTLDHLSKEKVTVTFNIVDGAINVLDIDGCDTTLNDRVIEEMEKISVKKYEENETYRIKLRFKQI